MRVVLPLLGCAMLLAATNACGRGAASADKTVQQGSASDAGGADSDESVPSRDTDGFTLALSDSLEGEEESSSATFCRRTLVPEHREIFTLLLKGERVAVLVSGRGEPPSTRERLWIHPDGQDGYHATIIDRQGDGGWTTYEAQRGRIRFTNVSDTKLQGYLEVTATRFDADAEAGAEGPFQATPSPDCGR